jgi:hypothetical protein
MRRILRAKRVKRSVWRKAEAPASTTVDEKFEAIRAALFGNQPREPARNG